MMLAPNDPALTLQREMEERAAADGRARQGNIETFTRMFLSLGPDCLKIATTRHDAELAEAKALAAARWSRLLDLEAQVVREEQELAARPKTRPSALGDDLLPDRAIEQRSRAWEAEAKDLREALRLLTEQAKRERKELESYAK